MHPTPILFVDHASALGGAEHSLLLLLKHLDRGRFTPHLACTTGLLEQAAQAQQVPIGKVALPRLRQVTQVTPNWLKGARAISQYAQSIKAQLLVANTVRAALYTALAARLIRRPFIWHMRDFWLSENKPSQLWVDTLGKWLLCQSATHVIVNSKAVAACLPAQTRLTVIHNGIEIGAFEPALDASLFRWEYQIPLEAPVVGMIGRLRPWKGQERFLRIVAQTLSLHPQTRFIVVGGDPFQVDDAYGQFLQQMVEQLGLTEHLTFTGHLNDVRPALAAMDIFVHPGDPEPFGLVNIEAMAMAKPVVAFDHGALPEIVQHGQTGYLVPPQNETKMSELIMNLINNSVQRHRMGQAGRTRVETHFTIERVASEVETVLETAIALKA